MRPGRNWSRILLSLSLKNFLDPALGILAAARICLRLSIPDGLRAGAIRPGFFRGLQRPGRELNPRITVLQTVVLPLHHRAVLR